MYLLDSVESGPVTTDTSSDDHEVIVEALEGAPVTGRRCGHLPGRPPSSGLPCSARARTAERAPPDDLFAESTEAEGRGGPREGVRDGAIRRTAGSVGGGGGKGGGKREGHGGLHRSNCEVGGIGMEGRWGGGGLCSGAQGGGPWRVRRGDGDDEVGLRVTVGIKHLTVLLQVGGLGVPAVKARNYG